jgi:hypothetical protein
MDCRLEETLSDEKPIDKSNEGNSEDEEVAVFQDKFGIIYYQPTYAAVWKREIRLPNGNIPAFACGALNKERYINPKIE